MRTYGAFAAIVGAIAGASLVLLQASEPEDGRKAPSPGNSYYLYTNRLTIEDSGVVRIPAGYVWSVETSWRGLDAQGGNLPDSRVMLRLHNPEVGFSALTAQMDLATAAKLHHDLGDVLVKKLQNPAYQDRSHVGSNKGVAPVRAALGIDSKGVAVPKDSDDR
jgi:hypothetical protein